eukprot:CAMPEP_0184250836 /NCGR_PEP_ID=MMETSP0977-20130417/4853_1 /TAXON_ID=483370 /ORGANISM="non described non described, Strain CCMP2097" /LENGTH=64 /DNA_ID=CAMNT_0026556275 /DNA_START=16 /DNA_END=210 /DNA_ORIENTATION=-
MGFKRHPLSGRRRRGRAEARRGYTQGSRARDEERLGANSAVSRAETLEVERARHATGTAATMRA